MQKDGKEGALHWQSNDGSGGGSYGASGGSKSAVGEIRERQNFKDEFYG